MKHVTNKFADHDKKDQSLTPVNSWNNLHFLLKASQPDDFLEDLRDRFNKCNDQPCSTENCWLCDEK